jgi:hypothetical protein
MPITEQQGYSAKVDIRLHVNGLSLDVAQVSHRFLILREPCEVQPGTDGKIVVTIDGHEQVYAVIFHEGIRAESLRVNFL